MIGISEREGKNSVRAAEKKLLQREEDLRSGIRPDDDTEIPAEAKAEIAKIFGPGKVLNR
jgi:hypothetical protein